MTARSVRLFCAAAAARAREVRFIAADDLPLSPNFARDSVALHFTWHRDVGAVARDTRPALEAALAPFGARPHWGKLFGHGAAELAALYGEVGSILEFSARGW